MGEIGDFPPKPLVNTAVSVYVFYKNSLGGRDRAKYEVPPDWAGHNPDFLAHQALTAAEKEGELDLFFPPDLHAFVVYTNTLLN